ncbi:hypothetical protein [Microvirga guangxiensis]|uniref:Uncharacterized protein n=1 Tax=Microvirga guangxiensis TaxID=549386 RepID=A0A1G5KHE8_9HYPH|nr:hypothetical protein [Microvirga guangxiensis]SCZ00033.1 hypothetical protein SAMN02927923_03320 [Microvirga guangxiensis]
MMRGIHWFNDEAGDYDQQEREYSSSYATMLSKITGEARTHFEREVRDVVFDKAYPLMSEIEEDEETIVLKVMVTLRKGCGPIVSVTSETQPVGQAE